MNGTSMTEFVDSGPGGLRILLLFEIDHGQGLAAVVRLA
jgi:hypothetical protein